MHEEKEIESFVKALEEEEEEELKSDESVVRNSLGSKMEWQ
jgi:hypothetical protein